MQCVFSPVVYDELSGCDRREYILEYKEKDCCGYYNLISLQNKDNDHSPKSAYIGEHYFKPPYTLLYLSYFFKLMLSTLKRAGLITKLQNYILYKYPPIYLYTALVS